MFRSNKMQLAGVLSLALAATANANLRDIPFDQDQTGEGTYYNDVGYGACGTSIDASKDTLVAISWKYWTSANPNADPLCSNVCISATYNGKTVRNIPVKDKCPGCDTTHVDLSESVFQQFADTSVGVLQGLSWRFTHCNEGGISVTDLNQEITKKADSKEFDVIIDDIDIHIKKENGSVEVTVGEVPAKNSSLGLAGIPFGKQISGEGTYYNNVGVGSCGTNINAATDNLVAIPHSYWTTANPNADPLCSKVCISATYNGKVVSGIPVKDKCPSCDAGHVDLSEAVFKKFASTSVGVLKGLTWEFTHC